MIGENPGLFKFWSLSRSFQIITSIPESKSTLAAFQLTPSRLFVHPENTMNFTLFGSPKPPMMAFQRYLTIPCHTSFKNTKPQIRRYKHAFRHAYLKPLKAKYLTHANAFSFPKFTAVYKTTPSSTWMWRHRYSIRLCWEQLHGNSRPRQGLFRCAQ